MKGADGFARLFETGQYGRLYIVSGRRAQAATFRVFVLPAGEQAAPNGPYNAPLNRDAVEVDDISGRQPGWIESCGGLHQANWQQDFAALVEARCAAVDAPAAERDARAGDLVAGLRWRRARMLTATEFTAPRGQILFGR